MQQNKIIQSFRVAFQDAESKRQYDDNGYLIVKDNPITLEGVFEYAGSEIINVVDAEIVDEIDPLKIYKVYRPASELKSEQVQKGVSVLPIIDEHKFVGEKKKHLNPDRRDGVIQGAVIGMPRFNAPYLIADLIFYTSDIVQKIKDGKVELSLGYTSRMIKQNGVFNDEKYEFVMKDIVPNHLSLVEKGRSGSVVAVQDHLLINKENNMNLEELLAALNALSDEDKTKVVAALSGEKTVGDNEPPKVTDNNPEDPPKVTDDAGLEAKIDQLIEASKAAGDFTALKDEFKSMLKDSEEKKAVADEEAKKEEAVKDEEIKALTDSVANLQKAQAEGKKVKEVIKLIRQVSHKTGAVADADIERFDTAEGLAKHFVDSHGMPKPFASSIDNLKSFAANNQRQSAVTDSAPKPTAQLPDELSFLKV